MTYQDVIALIQAVGIPVLGLAIGIAGALIARAGNAISAQQKRIADVSLQNQIYDRRYRIYDAARTALREVLGMPTSMIETIGRSLQTRRMLFSCSMTTWLHI